jgi:5-methyltetrahydrofolate--homocysteine methyltransferase
VTRLAAAGLVIPEGIDLGALGPLLGIGPKTGVASDETLSIRAADFLMNHDPSGANWIRLNKPAGGAGGGGRGGREGRRRRRA